MGLAASGFAQRFFQAARERAGTADILADRMEHFLGRRPSKSAINHYATGRDQPSPEVLAAAALAMAMSLDEHLAIENREETDREAIARIDGTLRELIDILGLEMAITAAGRPATEPAPNLQELARQVRELNEWRKQQGEDRQAGEVS